MLPPTLWARPEPLSPLPVLLLSSLLASSLSQLIYLPPPWGDCKAVAGDSEFYDTYSITACRIDCETRYLVENCNCRMVHMPGEPRAAGSRPSALGHGPMGILSLSSRRCPLLHPGAVQGVRRSGFR